VALAAATFNARTLFAGSWEITQLHGSAGSDAAGVDKGSLVLNLTSTADANAALRGVWTDPEDVKRIVQVRFESALEGTFYMQSTQPVARDEPSSDEEEDLGDLSAVFSFRFVNYTESCYLSSGPWLLKSTSTKHLPQQYSMAVCSSTAFVVTVNDATGATTLNIVWEKTVERPPPPWFQRFGMPYVLMFVMIGFSQWLKSRSANQQQAQQRQAARTATANASAGSSAAAAPASSAAPASAPAAGAASKKSD